jgi:hypothetical protein
VNILDFVLRENSPDFHQMAGLMYREEPREVYDDSIAIHYLQLPLVENTQEYANTPIYLWMKALTLARKLKKSVKDVVEMDSDLNDFYRSDHGFAQFADRHKTLGNDPILRKEHQDLKNAR